MQIGKIFTYPNKPATPGKKKDDNKDKKPLEQKKSFRKTASTSLTDDCMKKAVEVTDPELLNKLENITPITREVK